MNCLVYFYYLICNSLIIFLIETFLNINELYLFVDFIYKKIAIKLLIKNIVNYIFILKYFYKFIAINLKFYMKIY